MLSDQEGLGAVTSVANLEIGFLPVGYGKYGGSEGRSNKFLVNQQLSADQIARIEQRFQSYRPPAIFLSRRLRREVITGFTDHQSAGGSTLNEHAHSMGTSLEIEFKRIGARRAVANSRVAQAELAEIIAGVLGIEDFRFTSECPGGREEYRVKQVAKRWERSQRSPGTPRLRPI